MKKEFRRVFLIVTDGVGIGKDALQEAKNDRGANTFYSACKSGFCELETWESLGIGLIAKTSNPYAKKIKPKAYVAEVESKNVNKDSVSGHWEMMGFVNQKEAVNFLENGFPSQLVKRLKIAWDNREILGNKAGDGIKMIEEFWQEARQKNALILYTSPDSTLQIAAEESVIAPSLLNEYGKKAREICSSKPEWEVLRVITRPYIIEEKNNKITRTFRRRDFALSCPPNILNIINNSQIKTIGIGKVIDIFEKNFSQNIKGAGDGINMDICIDVAQKEDSKAFIFVNLVEFDSHFGHRRDVEGFAQNLNLFDIKLAKLLRTLNEEDLLIITSDHGNDPSFRGFDHTRELIPLTLYSKSFSQPKKLEKIWGLDAVGNLILEIFGLPLWENATRILEKLK